MTYEPVVRMRSGAHNGRRLVVVLPVLLASAVAGLPARSAAQTADSETTRVAEGVYQFRWQGHNAMFVVTPAGVVAFDPISAEAAARYAQEIRRVAPGAQLAAIVYSHSDADHASGAPVLVQAMGQQDVAIIAHERAVAAIRQSASATLPEPTVTFAERLIFAPGGRRIELHYVGPSHTDNLIVGFVPDAGTVFAVDFVSNDRVGYQALPGFHFPGVLHAIGRMLDLSFTAVIFGHGAPGNRATIQRQFNYYDDLRAAVSGALHAGLTEEQAATRIRLDAYAGWERYADWFPLNVRGMYRALAASGR